MSVAGNALHVRRLFEGAEPGQLEASVADHPRKILADQCWNLFCMKIWLRRASRLPHKVVSYLAFPGLQATLWDMITQVDRAITL